MITAHLAQLNVATLRRPMEHPDTAEFAAGLDVVNALGDAAPGFVWRLQDDSGNATHVQAFADPLTIVNLTVWESVRALSQFAYRGAHRDYFRRRAEWFTPESRTALWWIPRGSLPTVDDAVRRRAFIDRFGTSPHAFEIGFRGPQLVLVLDGETLVAHADGQRMGSASYRLVDDCTAELEPLELVPTATEWRVGEALRSELEATVRARGLRLA